jgi:hypothetical protein
MQAKTATRCRQHSNALLDLLLPQQCPYVDGFVLIIAFAPIAGRGWFLSPCLFANAVGGHLPMPLAIIFASLVLPKCHPWPKVEAAFYIVTAHSS